MASFSVVEFVDETDKDGCKQVDIIPSEWFEGTDEKLCWWPPVGQVNVTKAVKEGAPPAENWVLCNVRVMGNAGNLNFSHFKALFASRNLKPLSPTLFFFSC